MATAVVLSLAFLAGVTFVPITFRCMNMPVNTTNQSTSNNQGQQQQVLETQQKQQQQQNNTDIGYTSVEPVKEALSVQLKKKSKAKTQKEIEAILEEKQKKADEERAKETPGVICDEHEERKEFEKMVAESHPYGTVEEVNLYQAPAVLDMKEHADIILDDEDQDI